MRFTFILVFFLSITYSYSQDTTQYNETIKKIDTVIIYKDPVVITKSIVIEEAPVHKSSIWVDINGAINYYSSYYNVCTNCTDYFNKVKSSTKILPGGSAGVSLYYNKGKVLGIFGVSYSHYREKFIYSNSFYVNSFNYLETTAGVGYLIKKNKIAYAPIVGISLATLSSYQGFTYSPDSSGFIVSLGTARKYNSQVPGLIGSVKLLYNLSDKFKLSLEPYYRFDLYSVIYKKSQFTLQRNIFALKAGILISLK